MASQELLCGFDYMVWSPALEEVKTTLNLALTSIQGWIVVQRNTFEFVSEENEPFGCQSFLLEVSSGHYIHRVQGQKVEKGSLADPDGLKRKLIEIFEGTRPCLGYPVKIIHGNNKNFKLIDYPFPRHVSVRCQLYIKYDKSVEAKVCPACGEDWNKISQRTRNGAMEVVESHASSEENIPELDDEVEMAYEEEEGLASASDESTEDLPAPRQKRAKTKKDTETKRSRKAKQERDLLEEDKKNYTCNHCSETFVSLHCYHRHQRDKRRVGCRHCHQEDLITFSQVFNHVSYTHSPKLIEYYKYMQDEDEEKIMRVPRKCLMCDMVYNGMVMLHRHKELYHELGDYRCSDCQEPCLTYYDLMIHNYQQHAKPTEHIKPHELGVESIVHSDGLVEKKRTLFVCQHCQASYKADSRWTVHMRTKHSWGLFECKSCDEVCHYAKDYTAHMLNFHPEDPDIKCPSCAFVIPLRDDPESFNDHYRDCPYDSAKATSDFEKKNNLYQCYYCGKNYSSKNSFDAHIKLHEGIERFKCSQCDYGTNYKGVLLDHEKMHLREQGLTNADSNLVLFHQCDQCGKQYSNIQGLRDHIKRVHQGIKPSFPCKDCGKTFTNKASLYNHKKKEHGFVSNQTKKGRRPLL